MEVHFTSKLEEYYRKFIELQEQLKKSEEQRFILEMKFNEMVQVAKEEEQQHYRKLRAQYKRFLEEDKKRQERNERIIRNLERIETRIATLSAKTERINLLRRQYQNFLFRVANGNRPEISRERSFIREEPLKEQRANLCKDDFSLPQRHKGTLEPDQSLFEHPTVKKVLQKDQSNEEKIEILDRYLQSLSSQRCRDLINQENEAREKLALGTQQGIYWKGEPSTTNHATSIADDIMNSIYSRYYRNKNDGQLNLRTVGQNDNVGVTNVVVAETGNKLGGNSPESLKNAAVSVDTKFEANATPNLDVIESKSYNDQQMKQQTDVNCKEDAILSSSVAAENDEALLKIESKDPAAMNEEFKNNADIEGAPNEEQIIHEHKANNEPNLVKSDADEILSEQQQNGNFNDQNIPTKLDDKDQVIQDNQSNLETIEEYKEQPPAIEAEDNIIIKNQEENNHNSNNYQETDLTPQNTEEQSQVIYKQDSDQLIDHENEQPIIYDQTDPAYQQQPYDENGQPIQYDDNVQGYDQYGQFFLYDQNGQMVQPQYDQNGQIIPQYDESGQLIMLYDQNGHQQYDENGQPFQQYDASGQPIYGSDFVGQDGFYPQQEGQFNETSDAFYQEHAAPEEDVRLEEISGKCLDSVGQDGLYPQQEEISDAFYQEHAAPEDVQLKEISGKGDREYIEQQDEQLKEAEGNGGNREIDNSADDALVKEESPLDDVGTKDAAKVMDILDTDTESSKQNTSKISNDTDFDFT